MTWKTQTQIELEKFKAKEKRIKDDIESMQRRIEEQIKLKKQRRLS